MLNKLTNDMLDLAKMENNTFNFNEDYFDLTQTVSEAFNMIKFLANKKKIILKSTAKNIFSIFQRDNVKLPVVKVHNPEVLAYHRVNTVDHYNCNIDSDHDLMLFKNIYGDSSRYLQIIMNFLSNALKFTRERGVITIKLSLVEIQKKMKLSKAIASTLPHKFQPSASLE